MKGRVKGNRGTRADTHAGVYMLSERLPADTDGALMSGARSSLPSPTVSANDQPTGLEGSGRNESEMNGLDKNMRDKHAKAGGCMAHAQYH